MKRKQTMIGRHVTIIEEYDGLISIIGRAFSFFFSNENRNIKTTLAHPRTIKKLYKEAVKQARNTTGNRIIYSGKPNRG